jgi:hypothetical protein
VTTNLGLVEGLKSGRKGNRHWTRVGLALTLLRTIALKETDDPGFVGQLLVADWSLIVRVTPNRQAFGHGPPLGDLAPGFRPPKKKGYSAYPLTLSGLGER